MTPAAPSSQTILPAQTAVDALIAAEGNMHLAAERLQVPQHVLVASIAQDPTAQASLNSQLRALATLHTFDTLRAAKVLVESMMVDMEPADFAKFYNSLVQQVATLTDSHESTHNINVTEVMMKMLPPHVRDAFTRIIESPAPDAPSMHALTDPDDDEDAA